MVAILYLKHAIYSKWQLEKYPIQMWSHWSRLGHNETEIFAIVRWLSMGNNSYIVIYNASHFVNLLTVELKWKEKLISAKKWESKKGVMFVLWTKDCSNK